MSTLAISGNFKVNFEWTFDQRGLKQSFTDLLTFTASDYIPLGFPVAVYDTDESLSGMYICVNNTNLGASTSWLKIGGVELGAYTTGGVQLVVFNPIPGKMERGALNSIRVTLPEFIPAISSLMVTTTSSTLNWFIETTSPVTLTVKISDSLNLTFIDQTQFIITHDFGSSAARTIELGFSDNTKLESLVLINKQITNIVGLNLFTSLTTLDLDNNLLTNTALLLTLPSTVDYISLAGNTISTYTAGAMLATFLQLRLNNNQLTGTALSSILTYLDSNSIGSFLLDISNQTPVATLNAGGISAKAALIVDGSVIIN